MSLEDLVDSYKRGEKSLKKKLLPFVISSSIFSGIFSSFANEAPIIEWEKSFSLPNQTITYPSDIAEIAIDEYFIHGFTDNEGNEDCLPLFSSTISQFDQSTEIKERFGSCVNIYSNLIKYDQNKFLFGTTEFYHDEESYYKLFNLRVFDDKGRITLTKTLPQDLFSNKYLMFHIDDDLYAIGGSEDSKGINIIKFDENLNISQGYPKEILEDKSFYLTAVNVIDEKIVLTALRSDPVLYPGSYSTSFIKLDIDFNLEYFQDYGRFAIPKGNIEEIDGGYIFATDINTPWEEDDIAIFTTNLNGELKEGFPLEIDLGTNYLVNFSKNPEGNYTILSSNKGGRYFSPHLTAIDSKGKVLWKKNYTSAYERLISGWDFTSDGGYVLTGRQDSQSAFILKLSPEIFTPTFYDPTGIHGNHFNVNADGYNFSSWQPTPEESQNQFIEFIKNIIFSSQEKESDEQDISPYYPLIVPYLKNLPIKNDFGLSLSSSYYFTDYLYFLEDGIGVQMPTYDRSLDEESTRAKIKREQQKFPLVVMARNYGILSDLNSKERLIDILSNENEPALLNFINSDGETKTVVAYKLEINHENSTISLYDPEFPAQEKSAQIDSSGNFIYEDNVSSFVEDISWLSGGGILKETLDIVKEKYLDDLIRSGRDIITIFPESLSSKTISNNFLFVDSTGRKYGYENGSFINQLPIQQNLISGLTYFSIPSNLEYELFLSNSSNQNISIVNATSSSQTSLSYNNVSSSQLHFNSSSNSLFDEQILITPSSSQENKSIYDLNSDRTLDGNDLFYLTNKWEKNNGNLIYDQRFLLKLFENFKD